MFSNLERGQSITRGGLNIAYGYANLMSPSAAPSSMAQLNTFRLTPSKKAGMEKLPYNFLPTEDVQGDPAQRPIAQHLFFNYQIFGYLFMYQRLL